MKRFVVKLLLIGVGACAIAMGSFFHIKITDKGNITLNNIEALANGEGASYMCQGAGSVECHGYYVEVRVDYR